MNLPVLSAAGGADWEAALLAALSTAAAELTVVRRCVDVVELAAVAASGQAVAALVDARLRGLDPGIVERLRAEGIAVVGVIRPGDEQDIEHLRSIGVGFAIPADADVAVFIDVVNTAVSDTTADASTGVQRAFGTPATATGPLYRPERSAEPGDGAAPPTDLAEPGAVIVVWGPTGAPGRTTVAVNLAEEISRLGASCVLVDADVFGGVVANALGLLDESPGLVAACRQAQSRRLDLPGLAALCWQLNSRLRVLTGITRADRWPELRPTQFESVLAMCRRLAEFTVVDVGFCLESDEELSFDTVAPRRNGATLAALAVADVVLAIGSADPIGMQRLVRGLDELRAVETEASIRVVLNRVRSTSVPGRPEIELDAALRRFAGRAPSALLPYDREATDRATLAGQALAEAASGSPLRRSILELAVSVSGRPAPSRGRRRR